MPVQMRVRVREQDRGLNKLLASLKSTKNSKSSLYIGIQFPERRYSSKRGGSTVGVVGMSHEFGAATSKPPTTPKRWLRGTLERNRTKYNKIIEEELGKSLDKSQTVSEHRVFMRLGPVIRKDLRETINGMGLVDTGLLRRSVGFRISKGSKR
jgi:hypothetical protein